MQRVRSSARLRLQNLVSYGKPLLPSSTSPGERTYARIARGVIFVAIPRGLAVLAEVEPVSLGEWNTLFAHPAAAGLATLTFGSDESLNH
jgi:hypothetical protein